MKTDDWFFDYGHYVIFGLIGLVMVGILVSAYHNSRVKRKFIADCEADGKKNYECQAMWRAGEPDVTYIYR